MGEFGVRGTERDLDFISSEKQRGQVNKLYVSPWFLLARVKLYLQMLLPCFIRTLAQQERCWNLATQSYEGTF